MKKLWTQGDRIMLLVVWGLVVFSLALAPWHDTWGSALTVGLGGAGLVSVLVALVPGRLITRLTIGTTLMVLTALNIHQSHGMIELHFGIFALLAFLLFYRDWRVIGLSAGVIAAHHLSFNFMQEAGMPVYLFSHGQTGLGMVLTHAAYVVVEAGILIYMSVLGYREALVTQEIQEIGSHMKVLEDGSVNMAFVMSDSKTGFSRDFNKYIQAIRQLIGKVGEVAGVLKEAAAELNQVSSQLADGSQDVTGQTHTAAGTIEEMATNIRQMAESISMMGDNVTGASATAEQMSVNMSAISQAVDEMTRSVEAISTNAKDSLQISNQAKTMSRQATEAMKTLGDAAKEIGDISGLIKRIASQTNLLALNATIEASTAGDAGRGFAVVAGEIKQLAGQSSAAADTIAKTISHVQDNTQSAVHIINGMADIVDAINQSVGQISQAVANQSQTSNEISRNVNQAAKGVQETANTMAVVSVGSGHLTRNASEAAKGVQDVTVTLQGVSTSMDQSHSGVHHVADSSEGLRRMAEELHRMVSLFKLA
ncbi:MAG: methyl-accepting chemotaxis protein [Deltaproteobacteria bacterium]|nr:methyl-accepting chemotaxis protein [Deltaproteobacteria bacterium]